MAESKPIKHTDIAEEGIIRDFLQKEMKDLVKYIPEVEAAITGLAKNIQSQLGKIKVDSIDTAQLKEVNKLLDQSNQLEITAAKVKKIKIEQDVAEQKLIAQKLNNAKKEDAAQKNAIKNTNNLAKEVRELTKTLAAMKREDDPAGYDKIATQAGHLKQQIKEAKEAVAVFATESKAAQGKTLFSQMSHDLLDLNFQGAAEKAHLFAGVIKSMTFSEVIGGIKNFGSAIADITRALALNPFTLIVAGIAGVAMSLSQFYDNANLSTVAALNYSGGIDEITKSLQSATDELKKNTIAVQLNRGEITKGMADVMTSSLDVQGKLRAATEQYNKSQEEADKKFRDRKKELLDKSQESEYIKYSISWKMQLDAQEEQAAKQIAIEEKANEDAADKRLAAYNDLKATLLANSSEEAELKKAARKKEEDEQKKKDEAEYKRLLEQQKKIMKAQEDWDEAIEEQRRKDDLEAGEARTKHKMDEQEQGEKNRLDEIEAEKKQQQAQLDWDEAIEEQRRKDDKIALEERKKKLKEEADATVAALEKSFARRNELTKAHLDQDLQMRQRSILQQEQLASEGRANNLAFEKAAAAKDELQKQQLAKKQLKDAKTLALFRMLASAATSEDPVKALATALTTNGIAEAISGSYYEGTKGDSIADDLGKPLIPGKDGYVIRVDGAEKVFNPEDSAMIPKGMSNKTVARLAYNYQMGYLPEYGSGGSIGNSQVADEIKVLHNKFDNILDVIKSRPVSSTKIDARGIVTQTEFKNGLIKVSTQKPTDNRMI